MIDRNAYLQVLESIISIFFEPKNYLQLIFLIRPSCLPPSKGVLKNKSIILMASSSLTKRPGKLQTLASLWARAKRAISAFQHKARSEERRVGKECRCRWVEDH